jgi:hypothetical protein
VSESSSRQLEWAGCRRPSETLALRHKKVPCHTRCRTMASLLTPAKATDSKISNTVDSLKLTRRKFLIKQPGQAKTDSTATPQHKSSPLVRIKPDSELVTNTENTTDATPEEIQTLPPHVRDLASKLKSSTDSMKLNKVRMNKNKNDPTLASEATPEEIQTLPPHVRDLASKLKSTTDSMKLNKERMVKNK